MVPLYHGGP
ncbi:hypothetical protein E2C01_095291 [Portunus trituberculatus]|uniref:Uncharacterized protein n=1 Tax=Portunus trituberculatus TaxID=210409 RepID=A0A5B7IRB6_PORTR|nr:hypothetical protein [Portunus trituberculatus]MPC99849.1 hypothetical protein [Portunus trituberculatus]